MQVLEVRVTYPSTVQDIIYTVKSERSWCINQDLNTFTDGTWSREHNPKKHEITNFQTWDIRHRTCVSIYYIIKHVLCRILTHVLCLICEYLLYYQVFVAFSPFVHRCFDSCTTPNWKFLFLEDVYWKSTNLNFKIWSPILHGFCGMFISDIVVTIMWLAGH